MLRKEVSGYEYEEYCARYLKRKGYAHVRVTSLSGDQGADIIACRHRHRYAIQCKYYGRPVGNKAVQEVYAGMSYYDCDRAMVMTNSTFTKSAVELADKLGVELMEEVTVEYPFRRMAGRISALLLLMIVSFGLYQTYAESRPIILTAWGALITALLLIIGIRKFAGYIRSRGDEVPDGEEEEDSYREEESEWDGNPDDVDPEDEDAEYDADPEEYEDPEGE